MKRLTYTVHLEPDPESGGYTVTVPALRGCVTEGDTYEEALANAEEAILAYVESLEKDGLPAPVEPPPPPTEAVTITMRIHPIDDLPF